MPGKKRTVSSLKAAAKKCGTLYLATDLDREGEAIAWHLAQILGFKEENTYRVVFNAITKSAITTAFQNPGKLRMELGRLLSCVRARRCPSAGFWLSALLRSPRALGKGKCRRGAAKVPTSTSGVSRGRVLSRGKRIHPLDSALRLSFPAHHSTTIITVPLLCCYVTSWLLQ